MMTYDVYIGSRVSGSLPMMFIEGEGFRVPYLSFFVTVSKGFQA